MSERYCVICGALMPARKHKCIQCRRRLTDDRRRSNEFARILRKHGLLRGDKAA